ncbi:MAG: TatD family deoxyribonuclease [Coriobacteriaceae bacterium]|nr:TatD family deoxyribonuclease [Coriobacteriaceae bacterium]
MPPERGFGFYQRRKHDKWREVPAPEPALEAAVADSHAHIHMLPDPAWELVRCAMNGVDFVCEICDPSEDGTRPFDELDEWLEAAAAGLAAAGREAEAPNVRIAVGVHPHNAKLYDEAIEEQLLGLLRDPRVAALGEIGLDYHYDLSPRDVQRRVFRRQIEIAQELELPIALHLRGGEDPQADDAHAEAFEILHEMGALGPRTLLHCCALPPDEIAPWVEADCYIAFGGALTFKSADAAREGACLVPAERLMLETDSPYMTPEPMRGAACTPAHVVFTAACLAEVRGVEAGPAREAFLEQLNANTLAFYGR